MAASLVALACATATGPRAEAPAAPPESPARVALVAFLDAADAGRFEACYRMLSGALRARYTTERLAADFRAAPEGARERLSRARAAAAGTPEIADGRAEFPIGAGKAVRLVREDDRWRVEALE